MKYGESRRDFISQRERKTFHARNKDAVEFQISSLFIVVFSESLFLHKFSLSLSFTLFASRQSYLHIRLKHETEQQKKEKHTQKNCISRMGGEGGGERYDASHSIFFFLFFLSIHLYFCRFLNFTRMISKLVRLLLSSCAQN